MCPKLWEYRPELTFHTYCEHVNKFEFCKDKYSDCAMFIVYDGEFKYVFGENFGNAVRGDIIICPPSVMFARKVVLPLSFHFIRLTWMYKNETDNGVTIPIGKIQLSNLKRYEGTLVIMSNLSDDTFSYEYKNNLLKDIWYL